MQRFCSDRASGSLQTMTFCSDMIAGPVIATLTNAAQAPQASIICASLLPCWVNLTLWLAVAYQSAEKASCVDVHAPSPACLLCCAKIETGMYK